MLAALDEIDAAAETVASERAAPGFGKLRLQIDGMNKRFDEFVGALPSSPDPDAF